MAHPLVLPPWIIDKHKIGLLSDWVISRDDDLLFCFDPPGTTASLQHGLLFPSTRNTPSRATAVLNAMPPKPPKKRKLQEDSGNSSPKIGSETGGKRKASSNSSKPAPASTNDTSIWDAAHQRHQGAKSVDSKAAKDIQTSDGLQYQSRDDWDKAWGKDFHPDILTALWDVHQHGSGPSDGSVFVVSYHRSGKYIDSEANVLGVYATAAAANEHAMGFLIDKNDVNASGIVGPKGSSAFRRPFNGGGFSREDSYWDVDTAGCWQLHGDEYKWGSFDLRVEKRVVRTQPPPRKERSAEIGRGWGIRFGGV
jgi:hypothetical protein